MQLGCARAEVADDEPPRSRVRKRARRVAQIERGAPVALARECQHRVRPGDDRSVEALREVDAEERERRIRDRVDEPAYEPFGLLSKRVVVAAKRDDSHRWPRPGKARDTIGLEAGAPDHRACPKRAFVRVDPHLTGVQLEPPRPRDRSGSSRLLPGRRLRTLE